MDDLTEKIDRYLNSLMAEEERIAFEAELEKDQALRDEVELQRKTVELLEAAAFEETRQRVLEINNSDQSASPRYTMLKVAASLVLLVGLGYFLMRSQYTDSALFADYYQAYPDAITTMGVADNSAVNAMNFYNQEKYAEAVVEFKRLREAGEFEDKLIIYEAVSLVNSDNAAKAITLLQDYLSTNPTDAVACEWQLILAFLADERGEEAEILLTTFLQHNDGYQNQNAKQLLDDLQSVWR